VFLALFFGGLLLAPLAGPDLFPYSTFPMFSDATRALSRLEVSGPDGPLPSAAFGLASDYVMNRNVWVGRAIPPGPNPLGRPADPALVAERVRALNGEMRISGQPGRGTTIEADIPPAPRPPTGRG
jgi:hypothetical protein